MARTITVTDDELGATVTVRTETRAGVRVLSDVRFSASDIHGLSADAFRLIDEVGITLPLRPSDVLIEHGITLPSAPEPAAPTQPAAATQAEPAAPHDATDDREQQGPEPEAVLDLTVDEGAPVRAVLPQPRKPRRAGPRPSAQQIAAAFRRHKGDLQKIAAEFDAAPTTAANWIRYAREEGARIPAAGARR